MLKVLMRILIFSFSVAVVLVLTQDMLIFPGMFRSIPKLVPEGVEQTFIKTEDGERIEILRKQGKINKPLTGYSSILMHGNFETAYSSIPILEWLSSIGLDAYAYDFRGYGNSTGWPSEAGLYKDSKAVWSLLKEEKGIDAKKLLVVGFSIGTGISAELAKNINPKCLVLLSPYVDLPKVVSQNFVFIPLLPFLKYEIPTLKYLKNLTDTSVLIAHGESDTVIDFSNSEILYNEIRNSAPTRFLRHKKANHNDLLFYASNEIGKAIVECMQGEFRLERD